MDNKVFSFQDFDKEWTELGREICQAIYTLPHIQEIKHSLQKNGFMTLEEKSEFINICDKVKYDIIYAKYGSEGSQGYEKFSEAWQSWFQTKGVSSQKAGGQRNSVDHILFGSTPDPVEFLSSFEDEVLNH